MSQTLTAMLSSAFACKTARGAVVGPRGTGVGAAHGWRLPNSAHEGTALPHDRIQLPMLFNASLQFISYCIQNVNDTKFMTLTTRKLVASGLQLAF